MDRDDTVQVVGKRADGTEEVIGTAPMPPKMKAREIVREMLGPIDEDAGNDAAMALWCCEQLLEYIGKTQFVDAAMKALQTGATAAQQEPIAEEIKAQAREALDRMGVEVFMDDQRSPRDVLAAFISLAHAGPVQPVAVMAAQPADRGPFTVHEDGQFGAEVWSDDFEHDAKLQIRGDMAPETKLQYARWLAGVLNAAQAAQPSRWRYVKTGATYTEVGRGLLKDEVGSLGWQDAVIYRSEADGAIYARPADQFNDGRFERIGAASGTKEG